jgi:hypothetical protein
MPLLPLRGYDMNGMYVKKILPRAAFAVIITPLAALGPRGVLSPVLIMCIRKAIRKACTPAVGTLIDL